MYLLAIDQGTSSTRAAIFSVAGELIIFSQYPVTQYCPQPGWVEHDPEEIWQLTVQAMRDVIAQVDVNKILACGITNQRETTLIWDKKTGKCLTRAMVWQDRRTQDMCEELADYASLIRSKTGLCLDAYFSASKLSWLLANVPEAQRLVEHQQLAFGTIDCFLLWRLTQGQVHATDSTNAARTLLFNIHTHTWDTDLLELFKIPSSILPQVLANDSHFGTIDKQWLGRVIPITGMAGDQQAALFGQCCFNPGMIKATYGTGGFLLLNTGTQVINSQHLLSTIAYRVKEQTYYGLEGNMYDAGTTIKWLRDSLHMLTDSEESTKLAASLSQNDGVYLVPAFSGLGAPHWLTEPGAVIVGLSRQTSPAHIVRAALEAVAYQTQDILLAMQKDWTSPITVLRVDGGMVANAWLMQFLASLTHLPVQRPKLTEMTALGAAMLAALGCQAYSDLSAIAEQWHPGKQWQPAIADSATNHCYAGWQKAIKMISSAAGQV